jgi:hypothetical protein
MPADNPDRALQLAQQVPRTVGRTNASTWNRHRLDLANAHISLGNADKATEILTSLRKAHPGWLRYQQYGRDFVCAIEM